MAVDTGGSADKKASPPADYLSRWAGAWEKPADEPGRIGWHRREVHPALTKYLEKLLDTGGRRVFVPLCGKTVDMPYLASKGLDVVGVDAVQQAIDEFMVENPDIPMKAEEKTEDDKFQKFSAPHLAIYRGDFFEWTEQTAGEFDFVFDRASLQAIYPELRNKYAHIIASVMPKGGRMLLVTLDYDQALKNGPPYSVPLEEVKKLYSSSYSIEVLNSQNIVESMPKFKAAGVQTLLEITILLTKQ